jgi:lipopolysaccharide transport system permease protein
VKSNWRAVDPSELWVRRYLVWMLTVRDIKVRYKQSVLGFMWAVVRPLMLMIVFSYLFGSIANLPNNGLPYPVFVFAALIAWDLFANIVQGCANSITSNKAAVEKLYCPRLLFPISAVLVALFDFAITFFVFCVLLLAFGIPPSGNIIWLPLLVLAVVFAGLSVGLWLAPVAVWLRDVKYAVSYMLQLMLLLTPIGYGATAVPEKFAFIVTWNPMASLVETFRWSLLGTVSPSLHIGLISAGVISILLIGGVLFFNTLERSFADVI